MRGNEWADENRSSSTWTYPGTPMNPETVVRPEEHYYLRRKVKRRYRFRPRWNLLSLFLLFLIGGLVYQILLGVGYLVSYMHDEQERNNLYQQGMVLERELKSEQKHLTTDSHIAERARKLGMIKDGEKQYFFVEPLQDEQRPTVEKKKKNISIND